MADFPNEWTDMSSPTRPSTLVRSRSGRLLVCGGLGGAQHLVASAMPCRPGRSVGRAAVRAASPFAGAGWGHGWGMSQYGAYGAAQQGLTWKQILAFYYPGTS